MCTGDPRGGDTAVSTIAQASGKQPVRKNAYSAFQEDYRENLAIGGGSKKDMTFGQGRQAADRAWSDSSPAEKIGWQVQADRANARLGVGLPTASIVGPLDSHRRPAIAAPPGAPIRVPAVGSPAPPGAPIRVPDVGSQLALWATPVGDTSNALSTGACRVPKVLFNMGVHLSLQT